MTMAFVLRPKRVARVIR